MPTTTHAGALRDPIRYLDNVHRRMSEEIGKLGYYVQLKQGAQFTDFEEIDVRGTLRYLDKTIRLHADDEDASLFPRMIGTGDPEAERAAPLLAGIAEDQQTLAALFGKVNDLYDNWFTESSLTFHDVWELRRLVHDLASAHRRHVKIEKTQVFPIAERVLCPTCRSGIVHEMLMRRGLEESPQL